MLTFPKYGSYKESNIEWVGLIPNHWEVLPIRAIFEERRERNDGPKTDFILSVMKDIGIIPYDEKGNVGNKKSEKIENYKVVYPGDLVINKMNAIIGSLGISKYHGALSQVYIILYPKNKERNNQLFLGYLFQVKPFQTSLIKIAKGIMELRESIEFNEFKKLPLPLPTRLEQDKIVAFLDEKTREIDDAIAKKQRLIKLLQEQKAILINNAVTKGLDPDVPMRESGVEWLGGIPAHWETSRSKWLFMIRNERARSDDQQLSATQAYGVISQQEYMQREGRKVTQITQHLDKRRHVEIDDFVISMRSFQGGLERAWASGCIRSSYVVLQPSPQINVDFFAYLFKSYRYIQALRATSNFIRDGQDLNFNNFSLVDLPVISLEEQKAIANFLKEATLNLANTSELIQREIDLLSEYRTCLVSEAVTGKIII